MLRRLRSNSAAPRCPSRPRMRWPTAAAVTPSSLPASTKLSCRAAASKKRRLSSGGSWSTAAVRRPMVKPDYVISHPRARDKRRRRNGAAGTRPLAPPEAPAVGVARGGLVDVEEDAPDLLVIGPSPAVEAHAAAPPHEELGVEIGFSSMRMRWATAAGVTPNSSPAWAKLRSRAAASKNLRQSRGGREITDSGAGKGRVGFR